MEFAALGYYSGRDKVRVPIDRGTIRAAFGNHPQRLRVEALEGCIVLTDPSGPSFHDLDI